MSSGAQGGWASRFTLGHPPPPPQLAGAGRSYGGKYFAAVFAAEELAAGIFRVGHEAEDVAGFVADTGDIVEGAVGIGQWGGLPLGVDIAQEYLAIVAQPFQRLWIGEVASFAMLDRKLEQLTFPSLAGEGRIGFLDTQEDFLADKLKAGVAHQRSRQKPRFAENLKAVADAQHQSAAAGELHHAAHDRREARHGAAAEIIAVGESSRQDEAVEMARKLVLVPEKLDLLSQLALECIEDVLIVTGAGKNYHAPTHKQLLVLSPES